MRKSLTKRQVLMLLTICFIANKTQRLPSLIASNMGRNGWLVLVIMGLLDVAFLSITLLVNKMNNGRTCYGMCQRAGGAFFAKFIIAVFGLYFLLNALLPYEAVHDVFSNVLFEYLPWELYSLFIVFAVAFLACYGLTTMGRMSELFFYFIYVSFIVLIILGAMTTNFARVLPVYDINANKLFKTCFDYSLWFGDFTLIYMFMGKVKEDDGKMGWGIIVSIVVSVALLSLGYAIFYGLYENLAPEQTNFISAISQFSLLNLDIGRIDWFLVLFFEMATFLSSGVYIYSAGRCFCELFNIENEKIVCIVITAIIYFVDITVFKSIGQGASKLTFFAKYAYPLVVVLFPILLLIASFVAKNKDKKAMEKMGDAKNLSTLYSQSKIKLTQTLKKEKKSKLFAKSKKSLSQKEAGL